MHYIASGINESSVEMHLKVEEMKAWDQ